MMGTKMIKQIRDAIGNLNPNDVREHAEHPVTIELIASSNESYRQIGEFLVPPKVSEEKRRELRSILYRTGEAPAIPVLQIYEEGVTHPRDAFVFSHRDPHKVVHDILERRPELNLALARHFSPFRDAVVKQLIKTVAQENALFSLATAVPSIVPFISLPWAIGEFASDTAFLTMNQIRLAFQIAAASDRMVGYREQRGEIASIIASGFGWRSLARELVGHIPFGGGLIPKAGVAYAGTYVVGLSLDRYYHLGYGFSQREKKIAYATAYEKGKTVASALLETYRPRTQTT
jgi:hypothetical protein